MYLVSRLYSIIYLIMLELLNIVSMYLWESVLLIFLFSIRIWVSCLSFDLMFSFFSWFIFSSSFSACSFWCFKTLVKFVKCLCWMLLLCSKIKDQKKGLTWKFDKDFRLTRRLNRKKLFRGCFAGRVISMLSFRGFDVHELRCFCLPYLVLSSSSNTFQCWGRGEIDVLIGLDDLLHRKGYLKCLLFHFCCVYCVVNF